MRIEIVNFYPFEQNRINGNFTGHFRLKITIEGKEEDFTFELLGMQVTKKRERWFFRYASGKGLDAVTGEYIKFPTFQFFNKLQHEELIDYLFEHGSKYILDRMNDPVNPMIFPDIPEKRAKTLENPNKKFKKFKKPEAKRIIVDAPIGKARSASKFQNIGK